MRDDMFTKQHLEASRETWAGIKESPKAKIDPDIKEALRLAWDALSVCLEEFGRISLAEEAVERIVDVLEKRSEAF